MSQKHQGVVKISFIHPPGLPKQNLWEWGSCLSTHSKHPLISKPLRSLFSWLGMSFSQMPHDSFPHLLQLSAQRLLSQ